ncbi:MAG: hypothetical protein BRD23_01905 [Halobacteriales archaeon SW_9_67_25]|nr:MAG: hypothetical protein BRD23_01905 [Halobacteriales archaeon SW_9_67_25]
MTGHRDIIDGTGTVLVSSNRPDTGRTIDIYTSECDISNFAVDNSQETGVFSAASIDDQPSYFVSLAVEFAREWVTAVTDRIESTPAIPLGGVRGVDIVFEFVDRTEIVLHRLQLRGVGDIVGTRLRSIALQITLVDVGM